VPEPQSLDLTPIQAADLIHRELARAESAVDSHDLETALDGFVRALGLALQLGPAPAEQVLKAVLRAARQMGRRQEAEGLSALGPALVGVGEQVCAADALPPTATMDAWAAVTEDLGALIGQLGLALALPSDHRETMMESARTRAALLDDATFDLFHLTEWLDEFAANA
jgi:hypothetical protein